MYDISSLYVSNLYYTYLLSNKSYMMLFMFMRWIIFKKQN